MDAIPIIIAFGAVFVVVVFFFRKNRHDDAFTQRRLRAKERARRLARPEEPIDPNFQFDDPANSSE